MMTPAVRPRTWSWTGEFGGAAGDLGVSIPLAYALVAVCGYAVPRIFLLWGIVYVATGIFYRVPVSVQPLKAMAVVAIADGLDQATLATAAVAYGLLFAMLAASGLIPRISRLFSLPLVRGIQLGIGLMLGLKAVGLALDPRLMFGGEPLSSWSYWLIFLGSVLVLVLGRRFTRIPPVLMLLVLGMVAGRLAGGPPAVAAVAGEPVVWTLPRPDLLVDAFLLLMLPQLPLTLGNSVVAAADSCRLSWPERGHRVSVTRLATSIGVSNLVVGLAGGFPVCHGAGGIAAHARFGGRTGRTTVIIGTVFVAVALIPRAAGLLFLMPVPVLGAMLLMVSWSMMRLVTDLPGVRMQTVALVVGMVGLATRNLAVALAAGWLAERALPHFGRLVRWRPAEGSHGED